MRFARLGHPGRLAVFHLLMRFTPHGVRPAEIAAAMGLTQNTLSHHLAELTTSGLAQVERRGRSLHYSVDLDATEGLSGYLALDICRGAAARFRRGQFSGVFGGNRSEFAD